MARVGCSSRIMDVRLRVSVRDIMPITTTTNHLYVALRAKRCLKVESVSFSQTIIFAIASARDIWYTFRIAPTTGVPPVHSNKDTAKFV